MKNGCFDDFCDVGTVKTGAGIGGVGGETNLVVDYDMNRPPRSITGELGEIKDLRNIFSGCRKDKCKRIVKFVAC